MKTKDVLEEKKKIWESMSKNVFACQISPSNLCKMWENIRARVASKKNKEEAGRKKTGGGELKQEFSVSYKEYESLALSIIKRAEMLDDVSDGTSLPSQYQSSQPTPFLKSTPVFEQTKSMPRKDVRERLFEAQKEAIREESLMKSHLKIKISLILKQILYKKKT